MPDEKGGHGRGVRSDVKIVDVMVAVAVHRFAIRDSGRPRRMRELRVMVDRCIAYPRAQITNTRSRR